LCPLIINVFNNNPAAAIKSPYDFIIVEYKNKSVC